MSMAAKVTRDGNGQMAKAPGTLVVTAYASCPDITKTVTPDIKQPGRSKLMFIDLSGGKKRTGGSALAQVYNQVGNKVPDVDNPELLRSCFKAVQELIKNNLILSGHDISDGGLITCLLEMAFAGNCGLSIRLDSDESNILNYLFAEEPGLVIEYSPKNETHIRQTFEKYEINQNCHVIGKTSSDMQISIQNGTQTIYLEDMRLLRDIWQQTSYQLEKLQSNPACAESEYKFNYDRRGLNLSLAFTPELTPVKTLKSKTKPKIAILREEGVNGDREMAGAFYMAGFEPWDVTMSDLAEGRISLNKFNGVVFCGGFAHADVLDAGKGWSGVIRFNHGIRKEFDSFYDRSNTFSLGVCNGCQTMALLGWIPWKSIEMMNQPRFVLNESAMFESRFLAVKILESPSIMLKGMEKSTLGIWVAHGEGRFVCNNDSLFTELQNKKLTPLRYVDDSGEITTIYPANPNGSPLGIAALCSSDGRHLAMMPHPERVFLRWQWPYWPKDWPDVKAGPWLKLFQNAREWCETVG